MVRCLASSESALGRPRHHENWGIFKRHFWGEYVRHSHYSSNHDEIVAPETGTLRRVALHVVDGLALVHALLLRIQALLLPFKTLVFGGH